MSFAANALERSVVMPRKSWSKKDERQYEHVKESEMKRHGAKRAKEIAARTVNKQRSSEGRTKSSSSR